MNEQLPKTDERRAIERWENEGGKTISFGNAMSLGVNLFDSHRGLNALIAENDPRINTNAHEAYSGFVPFMDLLAGVSPP